MQNVFRGVCSIWFVSEPLLKARAVLRPRPRPLLCFASPHGADGATGGDSGGGGCVNSTSSRASSHRFCLDAFRQFDVRCPRSSLRSHLSSSRLPRAVVVSGTGPLSAMQELFCEVWFMLKIVMFIGPYVLNAVPREVALIKELMDVGIYALMPAVGPSSSTSEHLRFARRRRLRRALSQLAVER